MRTSTSFYCITFVTLLMALTFASLRPIEMNCKIESFGQPPEAEYKAMIERTRFKHLQNITDNLNVLNGGGECTNFYDYNACLEFRHADLYGAQITRLIESDNIDALNERIQEIYDETQYWVLNLTWVEVETADLDDTIIILGDRNCTKEIVADRTLDYQVGEIIPCYICAFGPSSTCNISLVKSDTPEALMFAFIRIASSFGIFALIAHVLEMCIEREDDNDNDNDNDEDNVVYRRRDGLGDEGDEDEDNDDDYEYEYEYSEHDPNEVVFDPDLDETESDEEQTSVFDISGMADAILRKLNSDETQDDPTKILDSDSSDEVINEHVNEQQPFGGQFNWVDTGLN